MRVNISLKAKFVIITLSSFLVIGPVVYLTGRYQIEQFLLDVSKKDVSATIQHQAEKYLELSKPTSLKNRSGYNTFVESLKAISEAKDIKILDPNGIVIYSENSTLIGQNLISFLDVQKAINGTISLASIDKTAKRGTIYVPIRVQTGETKGIVIASISLIDALEEIDSFVLRFILITGGLSLFFVFISYLVYSNATDSMMEQDRSILDQSKALEEEKQLDEAIMSSIAESLVVINKDGQIMVFNPEAERITGFKSSDVEYRLYRKIIDFCNKDGRQSEKNPITECLNSGKIVQAGVKEGLFIKSSKKELVPISVNVAPIFGKEHDVRGVVATIQDVTIEKELDKVKDEFVYVVAHELGNPIFALDGYLSILQDSAKKYDKNTRTIIESAKNINRDLSGLVNDLLEVVRSESGQLKIETIPIDLSQITYMVTENSRFKAKDKKIKLEYKKHPSLKVMGDEKKVQEVLTNLVDNAIKYTPSGGKVEVWHDIADGIATTHIKDNGFGMSEEALSHLFEKFFRVKTDKTKGISGTGLGLFICKQIIEKFGGKIWAESEEGKGSTFSFSLKVARK